MSLCEMLLSIIAVVVVLEGAWGAQQRQQQQQRQLQQQQQQQDDVSDLKLLVPLLRVEDEEIPETDAWRVIDSSSSEEGSEYEALALSKILNQLKAKYAQAPKPAPKPAPYRPRVYQLGVHDHSEHEGRPCPICLLLNSLKALQQYQGADVRLESRIQPQGVGNWLLNSKQQRGQKRGQQYEQQYGQQYEQQYKQQYGQQRAQQSPQKRIQRQGQQQACAVSVFELEEARRAGDGPQYLDDVVPKNKPPVP